MGFGLPAEDDGREAHSTRAAALGSRRHGDTQMTYSRLTFIAAAALVLSACYTAPTRPPVLDDARIAVEGARANPQVTTFAPGELRDAIGAYERAEAMLRNDGDISEVRQLSRVARDRAAMAQELARTRYSEQAALASAERDRERLALRERELQEAARSAQLAEARAESARRSALEAEAQARAAQQQAASARPRAQSSPERSAVLESELRQLAATKSDRGMVVTLNDVLFDTGSAKLRPGGLRLLARLAEFLREYPERAIAIEGFTDSGGSAEVNQDLSERRASAVRQALVDGGVDGSRVFVRGFGDAYPVASNDTREGRQRNRRVEVVVSDERGEIGPRVATYAGR
jgi:outer membrane protein OmpA-like peptidoglycan-associated protein